MASYEKKDKRQERDSSLAGIILTAVLHLALFAIVTTSGLKYLYPPPPEQSMLVEFVDTEPEEPQQITFGTQPRAADADPEENINLVQKSEAQMEGTGANEAPEATVGDDGDVAPQSAEKVSDELKAGHARGNTLSGKTSGEPNARLKGRTVVGRLPKPAYAVQNSGTVVVDILVDRYGNVTSAVPGGTGTTVTDKTLWEAARKAALNTQFNVKADAPLQQAGTITYIFRLQ